jgi:hypothetical protein
VVLRIILLMFGLVVAACAEQERMPAPTTVPAVEQAPAASPPAVQRAPKAGAAPPPVTGPAGEMLDELPAGAGWTVLIYAWADDEQGESVAAAINEMEAIGPPAGTNVIVQVGGAPADAARRYLLASDGDPATVGSTLLAELETEATSTAVEITEFVAWGSDAYPDTRLALWLWRVEGGWAGTASEGLQEGLSVSDLAEQLATLPGAVRPLELVAWDWALAGEIATLAALQPLARTAVVPVNPLQGDRWDYAAALAALAASGPAGGIELALTISAHLAPHGEPPPTVVDLQPLSRVLAALEELATALQAEPALNAAAAGGARAAAERLVPARPGSSSGLLLVSLSRFAAVLAQRSPDPAVVAAAARLGGALAEIVDAPDGREPAAAEPITSFFPADGGRLEAAYVAVAPAGWAEFLRSYYETAAAVPPPALSLLQVAGAAGGVNLPVFTAFELAGRQIEHVQVAAWRIEEGGARLVSTAFLPPEPQLAAENAPSPRWRDGVHEGFYIWDTRAAYLSDGQAGEFVVLWPVAPDSSDLLVPGRLETEDGAVVEHAALHFDGATGSLRATWDLAGSLPRRLNPGPGAVFSPYVYRQTAEEGLLPGGGAAIQFGETGPAYLLQALPVGDYQLQFTAATSGGAATIAEAEIAVNNEGFDGATSTYLDPYAGFQFALPAGWDPPRYEDGRLVSASADGSIVLVVSRYPATGRRTSELRAQTLEQFGAVNTVFAESRPVAGSRGELVAYSYEGDGGARTGVFNAFIAGENAYVVDVDGPASVEAETLAVLEQITASWLSRPLGVGHVPGSWRALELPAFTASVPKDYSHQSLANGWELFSDEGRFVALRREPATGQSRAARVQHWLDVADEGVAGFVQEPLFQFELGGRGWVRADFTYERDEQQVRGLVMTTVADGEEIAAWIEAPAAQAGELIDALFLALVAEAAGSSIDEGLLYHANFEMPSTWGAGDQEGARGEIDGGVYRLEVLAEEGFFWTAAGESFSDGVYEVTATQLVGPLNNGYGLLLRAQPEGAGFYLLAVSGDGYIWIGHCQDSCGSLAPLVGEGWFAHTAVQQGLDAPNRLRVVADGEELHFYVNDEQVGAASGLALSAGDVGLFVETLGQGGVTVAFDDLRVYAR